MNEKFVALDCQSAAQPITNRRHYKWGTLWVVSVMLV